MSNNSKDYVRLKIFLILFLIFYFVAGLSTEIFLPGKEKNLPPFFSWFLFDRVPNDKNLTEYKVRILEYNNKALNPPVFFDQAHGIIDNPQSPKMRILIQRLGQSMERKSEDESLRLRRLLEQVYLPQNLRYEIVIVTYDPILRFKTGQFEIKILGEFKKE